MTYDTWGSLESNWRLNGERAQVAGPPFRVAYRPHLACYTADAPPQLIPWWWFGVFGRLSSGGYVVPVACVPFW